MDNSQGSPNDTGAAVKFTVDLEQIALTEDECNAFQNQLTKLAVEYAQKSSSASRARREPYVKITFVKAIPPTR